MLGGLINRMFPGAPAGATFDDVRLASETGAAHVVDVREPAEFAAGHVPGSVNLPLSRFDPAALPAGKPVILIRQAGGRSARALGACGASGRQDIRHYAGGMSGWRSFGGPVAR